MKGAIMLRINRASAKGERITATFTSGASRRRVTVCDAIRHGFNVSSADAAEVVTLIRAQVERDNNKLCTSSPLKRRISR